MKFLLVVVLLAGTAGLLYFQGFFGEQQNANSLGTYLDSDIPYSIHGGAASFDKLNRVLEGDLDLLKDAATLLNQADSKLLNEDGAHFILNPKGKRVYAYSKSQGVVLLPKSERLVKSSEPSTLPLAGRLPFIALSPSAYHSLLPNLAFAPVYFGTEQNKTALYISAEQKASKFWTTLKPTALTNGGFILNTPWTHQEIFMSADSFSLLNSAIKNDALRQLIQPWFSGEITLVKTVDHEVAFLHSLPDLDLQKFERAMLNELSGVKLNNGMVLKGINAEPLLPTSSSLYVRMAQKGMVLAITKNAKAASDQWVFKPRKQTGSYNGQKKRIVNLRSGVDLNASALKQVFSPKDLLHLKTLEPLELTYNSNDSRVDVTIRHNLGVKDDIPEGPNPPPAVNASGRKYAVFKNHRSSKHEVLFQDSQNDLVRIKESGKVEKVKGLDQPILGKIQQIDFFKNGKFQYLFNTTSHLHLVDILGRDVRGFPKKIDVASGGLLCVDYDGKKNYRYFIPMTNGSIRGYYRDGKNLPGWSPKKDVGLINHQGQHLTFRNKDYLLFKNSKGELLSFKRNGDLRNDAMELDDIGDRDFIIAASSHGFSGVYNGSDGKSYHIAADGKTKVIESLEVNPGSSSLFVELDGKAPAELISQIENGIEVGHIKNGTYKKLGSRSLDMDILKVEVLKTKGKKDKVNVWLSDGSIKTLQGLELKEDHSVDGVFVFESKGKLYILSEKSGDAFEINALD